MVNSDLWGWMTKLIDITGKAKSGEWGTDDDIGNGIPVLRTTNFTYTGKINFNDVITRTIKKKNIEDKYLRKGDIIIEKSGGSDKFPVGRVIYFDGEENKYLFNNFTGLLRIQDKEKWYPKYVLYSLLANYNRGGTRRFENKTTGLHNLKIDDYVKKFDVKDIEYANQVNISIQLDKLDKIICKYNEEIKMLDDLIKARFVEMFGDVNYAKNTIALNKVCFGITDGSHNPPKGIEKSKYIMISSQNIQNNQINYDNIRYLSDNDFKIEDKRTNIHAGDVLLTIVGTIGRSAVVKEKMNITSQRSVCIIHPNLDLINSTFLKYMLDCLNPTIQQEARGIAQKGIYLKQIKSLQIINPKIEKQLQFVNFVEEVDKSKFMNKKVICKFLMEGVKIK